jgi:hypothetical protein
LVSASLSDPTFFIILKTYNMKRLLITIGVLVLVFLCEENFAQGKVKMKEKSTSATNMDYPYTANYSSNFRMGDPANSKMILNLWKDWDDNAFSRHDYMADTIVMFFPDGTMAKGKDSVMAGAKRFRGALSSANSTLDAWVPLKSVDKNENWVALWGSETDTWPDGKTEKRDVQEIWRINKDGKVDFMKQFYAKPTMQQQ